MNRKERRMQTKQRFCMANLVYGQLYPQLWLENQLKSLCDPSNVPALMDRYEFEYVLFTDDETLNGISRHPAFMALGQLMPIHVVKLGWPPDIDKFGSRYPLLVDMFHKVLPEAIATGAWLGVWVADLVFAKSALPRMLKRLEAGHDAVFNVPIRSAADSVNSLLAKLPGAPSDLELFEMAFRNLHHLWTHSTWNNPYFSRMPYSMLWKSETGLVAHNYGITPIVFKPSDALKEVRGVIDADVPSFFKNPYWATDWTDAPVAGVEPLSNGHYPPFGGRAIPQEVAEWAQVGTVAVQDDYLSHPLYYPSKKIFNAPELAAQAQEIALDIQKYSREKRPREQT